jgi:hypothetical protein
MSGRYNVAVLKKQKLPDILKLRPEATFGLSRLTDFPTALANYKMLANLRSIAFHYGWLL